MKKRFEKNFILFKVQKCEGKGSTKKSAKQNAAEAMLIKLGIQPKLNNIKPVLKNTQTMTSTNAPIDAVEQQQQLQSQIEQAGSNSGNQLNTIVDGEKLSEKNNERRVKFMDEDLVITPNENSNKPSANILGRLYF